MTTETVSLYAGMLGNAAINDGTYTMASFLNPTGVVLDTAGDAYVADSAIRKLSGGSVTTIAGDPTTMGLVNGPSLLASFNFPLESSSPVHLVLQRCLIMCSYDVQMLALDPSEQFLLVTDCDNNVIRFVSISPVPTAPPMPPPASQPASVTTTIVGSGVVGHADGPALLGATLNGPVGVVITANSGTVYWSDYLSCTIRKMDLVGSGVRSGDASMLFTC